MTAKPSKASVMLLSALRQYMHNDGSGLLAGYDCAEVDRIVDELLDRTEGAEALAGARLCAIPTDAKMVAVFADIAPEHREQAEEFAEAIKKRCTSGQWTLVAFFPIGADIQATTELALSAAGWVRPPRQANVIPDAGLAMLQECAPDGVKVERGDS